MKLVVDFRDDLHDGRYFLDQLHGEAGDAFDDQLDRAVFHHHLLVVALDLVVVAGLHELGHVHVDLVLLAGELVDEGPLEVREVGYVGVIFIIRPNTVVVAFTPSLQCSQVLLLHQRVLYHIQG